MVRKYPFLSKLAIVLVVVFSPFVAGCNSWLSLPEPQLPVASQVFDVNGQVIAHLYQENRVEVPLKDISPYMRQAIVAIEDERFYQHVGIDPIGIARAIWVDLRAGRVVEGGSTITQQTVKNLYLTQERTLIRKFKELVLTIQLERRYTKDEILEMYLNTIYFGQGAYGIEVASQTYFGKPAKNLTLAESAMLAGIPRSPANYSPFRNLERAKERQGVVLDRLVKLGWISNEAAEKAREEPIRLAQPKERITRAPYLMDEIREYVISHYENGATLLYGEGLSIYTTIDLKMQEAAERAFSEVVAGTKPDVEGALVAIDPTNGYIKAMIGGRNFAQSKFNRAMQAKRQPGSAFKPFLYTAAIDRGYTAARTYMCEPTKFPQPDGTVYKPTDYGDKPYHYRPFTLKEALMISDNVVSVQLNQEIGPSVLVDYAHRMGIESYLRPYLSLALGTSEVTVLEMAKAYGPLASGGLLTRPFYLLKIVDRYGRVLEEHRPQVSQVLDPVTAYIVTDMLKGVLQSGGTGSHLAGIVGRPAAGKTGTTEEFRDAWFVGYTPQLVCAVWIGYDQPTQPVGIPGGRIAGPIWAKFMRDALAGVPPTDFPVPPGIVLANVDAENGYLATPWCPKTITAAFRAGTEPKEPCPQHAGPPLGLFFGP